MAVPTLISQLSQTALLNSPGGGEAPFPDNDDFLRALSAFVAILRDSGHQWVTSISGTDTITGSVAAGLAAYVAGQKFSFVTAGANTGTAPTVNFNALGAKSITRPDGSSVAVGEIKSGQVVHLVYTGPAMQLMSSTRATTADTATAATTATSATTATTATTASAAPWSGLTSVPANIAAVSGTDSIQKMSLVASVASTSGTAVTFTSIPTWAKKITISLSGVSTNGTSPVQVRIGSGSIDSTSYQSGGTYVGGTNEALGTNSGTGVVTEGSGAATILRHGHVCLTHIGSNVWTVSGVIGRQETPYAHIFGGSHTLAGVLDRVQITTVNGTDTFDAGTVGVLVEGY